MDAHAVDFPRLDVSHESSQRWSVDIATRESAIVVAGLNPRPALALGIRLATFALGIQGSRDVSVQQHHTALPDGARGELELDVAADGGFELGVRLRRDCDMVILADEKTSKT